MSFTPQTEQDSNDSEVDSSTLSAASRYLSQPTVESDWKALDACGLFNGPSEQNLTDSQWRLISLKSWYRNGYKEARWIRYDVDTNLLNIDIAYLVVHLFSRVPAPQIPQAIRIQPVFKKPTTAADIPLELHDLLPHYFIHAPCKNYTYGYVENAGHECHDWKDCERNYVLCSQSELHRMALVCRRWARAVQPAMFLAVRLDNEKLKSLATLLTTNPTTPVRQYITYINGGFDGAENLRNPSIHHLGLSLMPKLSGLKTSSLELRLEGPLPKKHQMLSSIHPPFPQVLPHFSAGIRKLHLENVHFKTFTHLVRLVKEMPSLYRVECTQVTWDTREGEVMYPTSYLAKHDPSEAVEYHYDYTVSMYASLPRNGSAWLGILLGATRADVLDRSDADLLRAITNASECNTTSREQDRIRLWSNRVNSLSADLRIHAYFTPRAGVRERRRIRAIAFEVFYWGQTNKWSKIIEALATFNALQVVLFVLEQNGSQTRYLNQIYPLMPDHALPMLKFALRDAHSPTGSYMQAILEDVDTDNELISLQVSPSRDYGPGKHFCSETSLHSILLSSGSAINAERISAIPSAWLSHFTFTSRLDFLAFFAAGLCFRFRNIRHLYPAVVSLPPPFSAVFAFLPYTSSINCTYLCVLVPSMERAQWHPYPISQEDTIDYIILPPR
ncbi:hypothetical protein NM688_g8903 [Phlebia brevispora]|uniref:Uncharacterized protein n=1 Tax=Phlebia brevispora TaxID=194682 RepID=A0ACC1RMC3_9APHY|nr:hypothetical protein NM688_g8903 [Phlebia brevispora]